MPKRKNKDNDKYILRKIRKLEMKIQRRRRISSSSDDSNAAFSLQEDNHPVVSEEISLVSDSINDAMNTSQSSPVELDRPITDLISDTHIISAGSKETSITLDDNILELLGETPCKNKSYSLPIQTELAVRWEHIATTGLSKTMKKDLLEKYLLPENCLKIGAPKLNPEIKAALSDTLVKKDKAIEFKQNQQAAVITCISQALTRMFNNQNKEADVIKLLLDATRLLCDSQHAESMSRRSFVTSTIKKEIKDQLYSTEIDSFLFGEKLADTLKAAKAINKSGEEMKTVFPPKLTQYKPRPLNVRPPLPLTRQAGAGRKLAFAAQQPHRYQTPRSAPPLSQPPRSPQQPQLQKQPQRLRGRIQTRR